MTTEPTATDPTFEATRAHLQDALNTAPAEVTAAIEHALTCTQDELTRWINGLGEPLIQPVRLRQQADTQP